MPRETTVLTDPNGRRIEVRSLSFYDQARLRRCIPPALFMDPIYCDMAASVAMVMTIDDKPMPTPSSNEMLEATMQKLGDEGMIAVQLHRRALLDAAAKKLKELEEIYADADAKVAPPLGEPTS